MLSVAAMKRNLGIDLFRIFAIFTVVLIHSASTDISYRDGVLRYLPPANACFAFLAGWFLFKPACENLTPSAIGGLLAKRLKRLFIPYVVWEMIYVLADMGFDLLSGKFQLSTWPDWIGIVFFGAGSVQLWFVITLVYVQIVLCGAMAVMVAVSGMKFVKGISGAGLFMMLAISVLLMRASGIENDYLRRFAFLLGYGAFGVGLRRAVHEVRGIMDGPIRIGMALIGIALVMVAWFLNVPEVVRVLAWCLVFGCLPIHSSLQKCLAYGSEVVMGIYLCHVLFTRVIAMGVPVVSRIIPNGYALVLVNAIIGFVVSLSFTLLVKRTRWRWIISM